MAAILALGLCLGTLKKAGSLGSPDFKVFYTAARHVFTDPENIYRVSPDRYLYPPSTALLLTPFGFSENYPAHQWAWHGLLGAVLFALSSVSGAAFFAMAVLARYLAITFSYGQVNLVIIGLLALCGWLGRRGRWGGAGAVWALAACVKVYPLVFGAMFLPRNRWRGLLVASFAGFVFLVLPLLVFGGELGFSLYRDFFAALADKGLPLHSHNQSLSAFLLRVFTNQEFYLHAVGPARFGLLDLDPGLVRFCAMLAGVFLVSLTWLRAWGRGLDPATALSAGAFSVLFLSHIVWKDYLLFLYFPLKELFARLPRKRALLLGGAFVAIVTAGSPDLVGHPLSTRLDACCVHLWAAALIWAVWWKR